MTETSTVEFTAVAEARIGGEFYRSAPIAFDLNGADFIADMPRTGDASTFRVLSGAASTPGAARFEKTFFDAVIFNIYRNGEPIQQVPVRNMFQTVTMDLAAFR